MKKIISIAFIVCVLAVSAYGMWIQRVLPNEDYRQNGIDHNLVRLERRLCFQDGINLKSGTTETIGRNPIYMQDCVVTKMIIRTTDFTSGGGSNAVVDFRIGSTTIVDNVTLAFTAVDQAIILTPANGTVIPIVQPSGASTYDIIMYRETASTKTTETVSVDVFGYYVD